MKCFLWARVSTTRQQRDGVSLDVQLRMAKEAERRFGLEIVKYYVVAETAYKPEARKRFQEMLADLKRHPEVRAIATYSLDRLARNFRDAVKLIEEMGVKIISLTEHFPEGPTGETMMWVTWSMAKALAVQTGKRASLGMEEVAKRGDYPSWPPVGFIRGKDGRLVHDPETAPVIRELFELAATGRYSITDLAKIAQAKGLRPRPFPNSSYRHSRSSMSRRNIHLILRNPLYCGKVRWKGKVYPGRHEPIVSEELFERVQYVLESHRNGIGGTSRRFAYRGLLLCGYCGTTVTAGIHKGLIYYRCTHSRQKCDLGYIREDRLGERLAEVVAQVEVPPQELPVLRRLCQKVIEERFDRARAERTRLEERLAELDRQIDAAIERQVRGAIPVALEGRYSTALESLAREREELEARLRALEEAPEGDSIEGAYELLEMLTNLQGIYKKSDELKRSALLRALVFNLRITRRKLVPNWHP